MGLENISLVPWDCINDCGMRKCECLCHRWDLWHRHKWFVCSYKGGCLRQFYILNWCHNPWYLELLMWFHTIVRFLPDLVFLCKIFSLCFQLSGYYLLASIASTETTTIVSGGAATSIWDGQTKDSPVSMDLMSGKALSKVSTASISCLCCQGLGCCSPAAPSAWAGLQSPSCRSPASS